MLPSPPCSGPATRIVAAAALIMAAACAGNAPPAARPDPAPEARVGVAPGASAPGAPNITTAPDPSDDGTPFPPAGYANLSFRHSVVTDGGSYLSPLIEIFGDVAIGQRVFIASNTILRADPGTRICVGEATNLQDNILLLALRNSPVPTALGTSCGLRASTLADSVSIAHQATIRNSRIGRFTFVGFRAFMENVVLEEGAFVLHGAVVRNVRIGRNRLVPVGAVISTQEQADALALKSAKESQFQLDVLGVNTELASEYSALYRAGGFDMVTKVSPSPRTSFNPGLWPTLGANVQLLEFARVVGDVRIGANGVIGRRTSIRADEGIPIVIGANAVIRDRVTFHSLKGTSIRVGDGLKTESNIVFHGPLIVGDRLTVGDDAIIYNSRIGNDVTVGNGSMVIGVTVRDGATVLDGTIVQTQAAADALPVARRGPPPERR